MKKLTRFLVPLLLILVIIVSVVWYLFVYDRAFTRDFLLQQARFQDAHGNARISSWFYDMAYSFSGQDENVAIELANQYKQSGNYTKAEYTLTHAIKNGPTVELYTALCKTYMEQDKLLDAVNMLDNISNPDIKIRINELRPSAPQADHEPGYYSQYIDLGLHSSAHTVYYTTNGEYPSINGSTYDGPISLPEGETVVYTIAVDDSGLVSPVTVLGYTITGVIKEVTFSDAAFEEAVRSLLDADSDEVIYSNELWDITEFTTPETMSSYADLALLTNLITLTINNDTIDSLSSLASLNKLRTLDLSGCRFSAEELEVLAQLPDLTSLTLADCGLSTIEGLSNVAGLNYLDLSENTVRNLAPLSNMGYLTDLNLQHNALTSLEAISGLSNLETLDVSYNSLTTLAPIASCVKLNWIDADNNQLTNVNGVDVLPLLDYLSVDYNQLTNVNALASCAELTNLSIANNSITDISALTALTNVEILDFSYNDVANLPKWEASTALQVIDGSYNALTSLDGLKIMENLAYIYMDYNQITNIDALAENYCLVQINVYGNAIPDVDKLIDHNIIVNYDPTVS